MKRKLYLIAAVAVLFSLAGCMKLMPEEPVPASDKEELVIDYSAPSFVAGFGSEEPGTKTYVGSDDKLYWTADDRVTIFAGTSANQQYVFTGETGSRTGTLHKVASDDTRKASSVSANYAVYPYDASITIGDNETIAVNLPQTQSYTKDGFGPGANTMVAVTDGTDDDRLTFKNVGGYLVLKLYGSLSVKSVTLFGQNGEKLSGAAKITASYGSAPTVSMAADANTSVTIDCGNGVKLGETAASATEFWFVLPPVSFSNGFTVQVTDTQGKTFSKSRITGGAIERNCVRTVNPFQIITTAGQFVRTTSDEEVIDADRIQQIVKSYGYEVSDYLIELGMKIIDQNGDIKLNRIVYTTTDRDGNIVEASGMVSYPAKRTKVYSKILSVQHYTVDIADAPSTSDMPIDMVAAFKDGNQIVVEADYLGYGVSRTADLQHPYMHNKLTGTTCADLIEAAQDFLSQKKNWNPSEVTIDMMGVSQGGAASVSLLEEVERRIGNGKSSWKVGTVWAASGPHDLTAFLDTFRTNPDATNLRIEFLIYAIRGLDYGDKLNLNYHNIFTPAMFSTGVVDQFSKTQVNAWRSLIRNRVGNKLSDVFNPDLFADGFNGNPDFIKLMKSVEKNSTINYSGKYKSKIKLYHGKNDDTVPYACSSNAKSVWGCSLVNNYDFSEHEDCCIEFYIKYVIDYYEDTSSWHLLPQTSELIWEIVKNLL